MVKIFLLLTQARNLTDQTIGLRARGALCQLPDIDPRKTRAIELSRIFRSSRDREHVSWVIRVFVDGRFTGIELAPLDLLLKYVRVSFTCEKKGEGLEVLCVHGVRENWTDYLHRHRYFGCMRNFFWDKRTPEPIAREDSSLAKKLRDLEGGDDLHQLVQTTLLNKRDLKGNDDFETAPLKKRIVEKTYEAKSPPTVVVSRVHPPSVSTLPSNEGGGRERRPGHVTTTNCLRGESEQVTDHNQGNTADSFVHVMLFIFALALIQFLPRLFAR